MIYLDNNATTEPCPEAVDAATEALSTYWQNPSSVHRAGQATRQRMELARQSVARLIGARPRDLTFTSGATESITLAILGTLRAWAGRRSTIITTAIEHEAVRGACARAQAELGATVQHVPVDSGGVIDVEALASMIDDDTAIVSVHGVNNEVGTIQPIAEIGQCCRERGVVGHVDATQWVGKLPLCVDASGEGLPIDLLSCSAHKFHGIKGTGALYAARGTRLAPMFRGSQERERRGGTEHVAGICAMGAAAEAAMAWLADDDARSRMGTLRDQLEAGVLSRIPGAVVNGPADPAQRIWNTTNIGFPGLEAEAILLLLSERSVYASAGAACSSGSLDPSPVLLAMGIPDHVAHGSIRLSLNRMTTTKTIDDAIEVIASSITRFG